MVSLWIVILTLALVGSGLLLIYRFSKSAELKKETYRKIPAHHANKKRRA